MDRRKALALAGTVAVTLLVGGTAMAANLGLLQAGQDRGPVGQLDVQNVASLTDRTVPPVPTTAAGTDPAVEVIEEVITVPGPSTGAPGAAGGPTVAGGERDDRDGSAPTVGRSPAGSPAGSSDDDAPVPAPPAPAGPSVTDDRGTELDDQAEAEHEDELEHEGSFDGEHEEHELDD